MSSRSARAQTARETLEILERGGYLGPGGREVAIGAALADAQARSVLYAPDRFAELFAARDRILRERGTEQGTRFEVVNETTLASARRLLMRKNTPVLALNFASARNPGGGFLNGSQAQEESLARASGLYSCLNPFHEAMYEVNRRHPSCLYTDHMIYAPDVPVFRDDHDTLLDSPYRLSILTAPAVNAGAVKRNEPENAGRITAVMRARIEKVLSVAVVQGHEALVLGAWGCGVFANDPNEIAALFAEALTGEGPFRAAFRTVAFAVLDRTPDQGVIGPFVQRFAPGS